MSLLSAQMSGKRGLREFGDAGADAIMTELKQLVSRNVMTGRHADALTREQRHAAL